MAKWSDHLISGIWEAGLNNSKYISHVMLHNDFDNNFSSGRKTPKDEVIKLLKAGKKIITITWNYNAATWNKGALVTYERRGDVEYLRTVKDTTVTDNLDNLIKMSAFD